MSDKPPPEKTSAYGQRLSNSIPAPLECDSDSDFNPGEYVYDSKPKGQIKRKRRSNLLQAKQRSRKRSRAVNTASENPLLEYFHDLDSHSASENEEREATRQRGIKEHEKEPEFMEADSEHENDEPIIRKTIMSRAEFRVVSDDSATESESENDQVSIPMAPESAPLFSTQVDDDDSATESATESASPAPPQNAFSDSATESESECELTIAAPDTRPNFSASPEQKRLGPMILDAKQRVKVPSSINMFLREYQREGIKFLWDRYQEERGGVLGDDMGLVSFYGFRHSPHVYNNAKRSGHTGKTIQIIAFLSAIMKKTGVKSDWGRRRKHVSDLQDGKGWKEKRILPPADAKWPTALIVAPSTVVLNWEREFEKWGYFEVGMFMGVREDREVVLNDFKMGRLDVVLTSFDLARREIDLLDGLPWSCIIVDEVHRVKNAKSKSSEAYHQFACRRRFGLTGTAIQNSYLELWTILDWTNPGRLGEERHWNDIVVRPLTVGQSAGASEDQRAKALAVSVTLRDRLLPQFFMRRTKDIIKEQLPVKTDEVVFCPLSSTQIAVYKRILDMHEVQNMIRKDDDCDCGSKKKRKTCCHRFVIGDVFKYMSILIKLSNHLALILPAPTDTPEQTTRHRRLAEMAFPNEPVPKYGPAILQPQFCGKWAVLEMLLKEWRKDCSNKVLIFTKSVKLLEMLDYHLRDRSYGFLKLDGSTKQADRMPMIDQFHEDATIFVFLISTLAGGTGLNLTGANKVVIFDPNWNPAHDLQAIDRAYRFGQTRDVSVYRLLGAGSIEELIYARQLYKQQQMAIGYQASIQTRYFEGVQGDTTKQGELFGVKNIFKLHEDTLATKMAIEKASLADLDWALANLSGKKQVRRDAEDFRDLDTRMAKEDNDLRGLGALLFDDDPLLPTGEDAIQKTLSAIGIKYSHRNNELLLPSRIEEERARKAVLERKRRRAETKKASVVVPQWPPKRSRKIATDSQTKLESRQMALIELEMIRSVEDLPAFAQSFARKSREEQNKILSRLDEHGRKSRR